MSWFGSVGAAAKFGVGGPKAPVLAPAPTLLGTPTPPDGAQARASATAQAVAAAKKQRLMKSGSASTATSALIGGAATPPATLHPRTLVGY